MKVWQAVLGAVALVMAKGVGEVRLEKVTFGYEAGRVVLDRVVGRVVPTRVTATFVPASSLSTPLVTTSSPGERPSSIAVMSSPFTT